jgi:glycosyltransferase involved in cell wall biosynthesis/Tfp pilus assembly protein PilF
VDPQVTLSAAAGTQMYRQLGLTALKRRQVKTALRYLRQAQRFDPNYAPIVQELGELLARQGRIAQAIAVLRHAIAIDPDWSWSYYHLAKCYERQGEWERALAAYQRTTELAPNFFWGFQDYGEALAKQGQHHAAAQALERATQLDPSFSWAYHHLGGSLAALGQYDQAVIAYQKAIERKPDFPWSYYNLGEALAKANRRDEARVAYQAAANLQPNLPGLADRMIDLLVQASNTHLDQQLQQASPKAGDRDLEAAYAAVQEKPNSVGRWLYLANLLRTQGKKVQALEAYQRVIDLSPTHTDARRYYDQLLATPVVDGFPPDLLLPPIVGENNDYTFITEQVQAFVETGQPYTLPVSVIIPTYNRKDALAKTLAALVHQTYPLSLIEVIIADDGSSDGVEEVIRRYEDHLEIVHVRQGDRGYRLAAVRNLGIRAARHEALIIFDCDVLPTPEFVEAYMRYLHVSDRAILIGHRRFVDPSHLSEADILANPNAIVHLPDIRTHNNSWEQEDDTPTTDWRIAVYEETDYLKQEIFPFRAFVGASAAYMRSALVQAGFYDEEFQAWGREDTEMGYRFYNEGFYFIPVMDAVGLHQEPPGGENETDRKGGLSITEALFVQKCPIPTYYRPYQPGTTYRVPKVSIYIPAYNVERFIRAAIDSVLNQTFSDLEVCIVDDGSTDNTLTVIEENYRHNPRVRWQTQPNGGIGKASNAAVRMCRGAYIGQLDADDLLTPDAVETLVNYLDRHNVGCVYGTRELIDAEGNKIGMPYNWPVFSREKLLLTMIVHHFRMFRRRDWMRTDGFAEDLVNAVDYDMFLKLSEVCTLVHLDKIMYSYRMHGTNTSIVDKSAQDRNDLIVLERALMRLGLAEQWEVYRPDPQDPRKTSFRRKQMAPAASEPARSGA